MTRGSVSRRLTDCKSAWPKATAPPAGMLLPMPSTARSCCARDDVDQEKEYVMSNDSVEIVHRFWEQVWNAHAPEAVDQLLTEHCVITSGGVDTVGREEFKNWVAAFLDRVEVMHVRVVESF